MRRAGAEPNPAIRSRRRGLAIASVALAAVALGLIPRGDTAPFTPGPLRVDPNRAPLGVLEGLPRIGPALASRIVEAREVAPFSGLDDLDRRVKGIGPATARAIGPLLRFDGEASPD